MEKIKPRCGYVNTNNMIINRGFQISRENLLASDASIIYHNQYFY